MTDVRSPYSGGRFRRALRAFVAGRAAQGLATAGLTLLTVRWLAPAEYGAYMLMWGAIELAVPLTSLGLLPAMQQFLPRLAQSGTAADYRRLVALVEWLRHGLILAVALMLAVVWPVTAQWLGLPAADPTMVWLFCALLVAALGARFAAEMMEALLEQRDAQFSRALQPALRLLGLVGLWLSNALGLLSLLVLDLVVSVLVWGVAQFWLRRSLLRHTPSGTETLDRRNLLRFAGYMSVAQLLQALGSDGALRLAVGRVLGVEAAGVFAFLQQLVMIGNRYLPSMLLANMVRPMLIARHQEGRRSEVAVGFGLLWKVNLVLTLMLLSAVLVGGDALLALISSGRVAQGGWPMAFLTLGLFFNAQSQVVSMAMQVYGYPGKVLTASLLAPLVLPLAMQGGVMAGVGGAAAGAALAIGVRGVLSLWMLQTRPYRMQLDLTGAAMVTALAASVCAVAYWALAWLGPFFAVALALCGLIVGLRLLRPVAAAESELILRASGRWAHWLRSWCRS